MHNLSPSRIHITNLCPTITSYASPLNHYNLCLTFASLEPPTKEELRILKASKEAQIEADRLLYMSRQAIRIKEMKVVAMELKLEERRNM